MRWARSGVWERIFADLVADKKNLYLMIDSTIVRAHQQAATGRKKGAPEDKALGRSRGGLSTKVHLLADETGPAGSLPHHSPGRPPNTPRQSACWKGNEPKP